MNEFLEQFLIESRELVEQAADDLLALEQAPDDRPRLDSAFRAFHTLKGAAGIVEFDAMARAVHAAEDLLASVRAGDQAVTADLVSSCLACLDQIGRWLEVIEVTEAPPEDADAAAAELIAAFARPSDPVLAEPPPAAAPDRGPGWIESLVASSARGAEARSAILYTPDPDCFFRGEDPLALVAQLPGLLAVRIEPRQPWPPLDDLDAFTCNLAIRALAARAPGELAAWVQPVSDQAQVVAVGDAAADDVRRTRAQAVLEAQLALVDRPKGGDFAGRLGSAGRTAAAALRYLGLGAEAGSIEAAAGRRA